MSRLEKKNKKNICYCFEIFVLNAIALTIKRKQKTNILRG